MSFLDIVKYKEDIGAVLEGISDIDKLFGSSVLITGAGGMLGSFITDTLLYLNDSRDAGIKIYAAGRNISRLLERFGERGDLFFVRHDLMEDVGFDFPVHYLIHAAGYSDPASFNTDPAGTVAGNVGGTYELLKYANTHGCRRFLYVSSGEVYGKGSPEKNSFEETYSGYVDPVAVRSCYPVSKRAAENLCVSYGIEYGLDAVIVRPCHIYGPCFKPDDSHAYVQFIKNALAGKDIVMKSAGSQTRSYIYAADCAAGILTALISGESGQAYNIANPGSIVTIADLAKEIASAAGVDVTFENPDEKDIRDRSPIQRQVLNADKLVSVGFRPAFGISEGIGHTFEILKECEESQGRD